MRVRRGTPLLAVAALAALSGAVIAASPTQDYKGKVKGAGPVSFQLRQGKVKRFQASMTVSCVSAVAPGLAKTQTYVIAPAGSARVDRKGGFTLKVDLPKQQFADETGKVIATLYSVKANVKGKLSGRNALGTAKVSYNRNQLSGSTIVIVACTSGKTPIKWTAKRG